MSEHGAEPVAKAGKELGFWMCTALVIGNTIGMGIFLLPASLAPYGFNALIGWGITVTGMTVLARVFARLARIFPDADGPHAYLRSTLGEWPAFLALWCYWISCWITNAALAVGIVGYLGTAVPQFAAVPPLALALTLLWLFVVLNLLGARAGGRVQVVTTALKLLPMAVVILLGGWLLLTEPIGLRAESPDHAAQLRRDAGRLDHRPVRDARRRVGGRAGRARARRRAHDSARDDGRDAAHGRDLRGRLGRGDHADPAAGARVVPGALCRPAQPVPRRGQRALARASSSS